MSRPLHIAIIGGGPCGLGAAFRLEELIRLGHPNLTWTLIDSSPNAGGLASSVVDPQGFTWDMGGHVIFSHYAYFSRLLDHLLPPSEWNEKVREAWVWMRDTFIPYPLQQNLHRLPKEDLLKAITGLIENERAKASFTRPLTFKDWLLQSFGAGLCDVFMLPYNFKVWAYPAEQMNVEWMGERVATVDTVRVISNVINQRDELGWGPNNTFRFPMHGGTGAIWQALYRALPPNNFRLGAKVVTVDAPGHRLLLEGGEVVAYDHLLSTMPMDRLLRCVEGTSIPRAVLEERAAQFKYSSSHILGFGMEGQPPAHLATKCWLYFPEADCPFYRCTVFSNYSPNLVPRPGQQWSIMCEVAESPCKPVDLQTIIAVTEQGLLNTKLLSPSDQVVSRFHTRLEYGYPTPFYGRDALLNPLHAELEKWQILSRGRFGCWKYEVSNQDHSLMLGVEAVDRITLGAEEMTFKYPNVVNANRDNVGRVPTFAAAKKEESKEEA